MDKEKRLETYQDLYAGTYEFEKVMVQARQKYIASLIEEIKPGTVVEVSCGIDQIFEKVEHLTSIRQWIIIEPSEIFVAEAQKLEKRDQRVKVVKGFFEDVVQSTPLPKADMCICSGLLNEIEKPEEILNAAKCILNTNGLIHINVPNAFSLHRQLACEMGLIDSVHQFSQRNKDFLQFHIFDKESLRKLVERVGLEIVEEGGYFLKPFTHKQMTGVIEVVGDQVLEGLWKVGRKYPELASEIFVNVRNKAA